MKTNRSRGLSSPTMPSTRGVNRGACSPPPPRLIFFCFERVFQSFGCLVFLSFFEEIIRSLPSPANPKNLPCFDSLYLTNPSPTDAHVATKQIESPTQPQSKRGKKLPEVNPKIKIVVSFWYCGFYLSVVDIQTCSTTAHWQTFPFICWFFSRFERGDNNGTYWVNLF